MKRRLALIFIFLVGLSLIEEVKTEQIVYLDFDGCTMYTQELSNYVGDTAGTFQLVDSVIFSFPTQKYVAGFTLKAELGGNGYYRVKLKIVYPDESYAWTDVWGPYYASSYTVVVISFKSPLIKLTDSVTVEIYADSDYSYKDNQLTVHTLDTQNTIYSKILSLKYIPPGAEDTAQGLLLNQTEIYLNQTYNLPEGALKFYLKWDGTKPLNITDNIGIDANGYIYVKDSAGNTYTLEGVTPPLGVYVPVAVGWKDGYGYIILNSTIIRLNWQGNLTLSKIGDINQQSGTVIDELIVFDSFISEDYILQVERQESFNINVNGKLIKVYPDGGVHLPAPTTISFYDENNTLLTYYDWYGSNEVYDAPNGTYKIILSAGGASSVYLVSALDSDIAFLSSDAQGVIEDISIIPNEPGTLVIKNTKGQIIYADSAKQTNTVLGTMGGSYYIKFTDTSNVTRAAGWFTFSGGGITLLLSSSIKEAKGLYADAWWDNGTLKVEFVDDLNATNSWNMTVTYYKQGGVISSFKLTETSKHYIASFIPPSDANYAFVEIKADNGFKKEIGVYLNDNYGSQTVPESVFPSWLLFGIFGIGGLLIAPARFRFVSPLIAVFILGFGKLSGIIDSPAWLLSSLTGLAILSLIIYRPSSRGGVI